MTLRRSGLTCVGIVLLTSFYFSSPSFAQTTRNYIVKLRDEPVVGHMKQQRPSNQFRIQMNGGDASAYRTQILARQSTLMRAIEAMPGARVQTQMDTVFNGLAVALRPDDVAAVEQNPMVDQVIPNVLYHKALDAALPLVNVPQAWTNLKIGGENNAGAGVRIAIIDTGIDNSHPMFQTSSLTAPSGFPRFTASTSTCANSDGQLTSSKIIVARNYVSLLDQADQNCDAQDRDGHGTFVAAIAGGRRVMTPFASISGVAPQAFLGSYKVFGTPGTNDQATLGAILKAIDDAVKDGMDVINLSLGSTASAVPEKDPLDIAIANATDAGATVVVAAGNDGPATGSVASPGTSPEAITVGASTNSRTLGNPLLIAANVPVPDALQNVGALPGNGPKAPANIGPAPLVDVASLGDNLTACFPLPAGSLRGKLAFIMRGTCAFSVKILNTTAAGALTAIIYNNQPNQPPVPMDVGNAVAIPAVMIGNTEGAALARLLATPGTSLQAVLQGKQTSIPTTPNQIADFSAEGPSIDLSIKPDLVAPGTSIYSATQRSFPAGDQYDASGFTISSGTSFSTPIVSGTVALLKQAMPGFTPLQIKSALVNTAARSISSSRGDPAGALADGNGLLDASSALSTPATVSPVSISYGSPPPGAVSLAPQSLTITNAAPSPDQFTLSAIPSSETDPLSLSISPSTLSLLPGASATVSISGSVPASGANVEGVIAIRSQNSQTSVTVPYWGTFLSPNINAGGVVNAASFSAGPSGFAPGEIISIFGSALVNASDVATTLPLPLSLGGATMKIGGQSAPLLFVSPTQINAQIPFEVDGRTSSSLVVTLNGLSSPPVTIPLALATPGIFASNQQGAGRGAILHAADSTPVTPLNPARTGEFLEIFATGLGVASPSVPTGAPALFPSVSVTRTQPSVAIAGQAVPVVFSGLAPGFVGLDQINIQLPAGIPSGEQTLIVNSNGVASNPVIVSIAP